MNYLPLLILGYLLISNKNSSYKEILNSLTEEEICMLLSYLGIDEAKAATISQALPTLLKGELDMQKIFQMGLPLITDFLSKQRQSTLTPCESEEDDLATISQAAGEEIYAQFRSYFN